MKRKTLAVIVGVAIAASVGAKELYHKIVAPEPIPASVEIIDENHIKRFSYVPQGSLFRSIKEWYDKDVEEYTKTEEILN